MPDGDPRYEKIPRPESIDFFVNGVTNHEQVTDINKISDIIYEVKKIDGDTLIVYLTNIYIVTEADIEEITMNASKFDINVIVTMSAWNSYTKEAKEYAKNQNIALFKYKEFYGALNFNGSKFINYKIKKDR